MFTGSNDRTTSPHTAIDLRLPESSQSPWLTPRLSRAWPPLDGNLDVDVAIIGGGITGLSAALALVEAGRHVVVIDAGELAGGETARTTAHLTECPDARARSLIDKFGVEQARASWEAGRAAIRHIEATILNHGIACDFRRTQGYLFSEHADGVAALADEQAACAELGVAATLLESDGELPFPTARALRFEGQAQVHALRYAHGLLAALTSAGCRFFEHTRAIEITEEPTPRVLTKSGVIHATDVIVATHVPLNKVMLQTKLASYRSYAIAARIDGRVPDGLHWDDEDPYHYVRGHEFDGEPHLIVGGEDHRTGQEDDTLAPFERLVAWSAARFSLREITQRWSGQIVESVDGLPYIGRNSFCEHVWEATGFSGNGMTFGTLAAQILRDRILGIVNPWAELFDATRITPVASARDYLRENVEFPRHFIVDRLERAPRDLDALANGEGDVFAFEGRKVAAYRDDAGELHLLSPTCTHLGCVVEFNRAEKTWDCPCHGARYGVDGEVLNGPAVRALERSLGTARRQTD